MAKFKLGAFISQVSGKLGGQIFYKKNGVGVVKNNVAKSGKYTASQSVQRVTARYLMSLYSQLSDTQKERWRDALGSYKYINAFGDTRLHNSFQLFQRINQFRHQVGMPITLDVPIFSKPTLATPSNYYISNSIIWLQNSNYNSDDFIIVYATPSISKGISEGSRYYRKIGVYTGMDFINGIDITNDYLSVFNAFLPSQQILLAYKTVSSISGYSNNILVPQDTKNVISNLVTPFMRIRSGGTNYSPTDGSTVWRGSSTNNGFTYSGGNIDNSENLTPRILPGYINPMGQFQIFPRGRRGLFTLNVPVPDGMYMLRYYVGRWPLSGDAIGSWVWDIVINGVVVFPNFDPILYFGSRTLHYVDFFVNVTNGEIVLTANEIVREALWSAVEIFQLNQA